MTEKQVEQVMEGVGTAGQIAMTVGTKVIASGLSGSTVIGDAAAAGTIALLANSPPEERSFVGTFALLGGGTAIKLLVITGGGVALGPAAAFVALGAATTGVLGFGFAKVLRAIVKE